jgi:hypothetical protein
MEKGVIMSFMGISDEDVELYGKYVKDSPEADEKIYLKLPEISDEFGSNGWFYLLMEVIREHITKQTLSEITLKDTTDDFIITTYNIKGQNLIRIDIRGKKD